MERIIRCLDAISMSDGQVSSTLDADLDLFDEAIRKTRHSTSAASSSRTNTSVSGDTPAAPTQTRQQFISTLQKTVAVKRNTQHMPNTHASHQPCGADVGADAASSEGGCRDSCPSLQVASCDGAQSRDVCWLAKRSRPAKRSRIHTHGHSAERAPAATFCIQRPHLLNAAASVRPDDSIRRLIGTPAAGIRARDSSGSTADRRRNALLPSRVSTNARSTFPMHASVIPGHSGCAPPPALPSLYKPMVSTASTSNRQASSAHSSHAGHKVGSKGAQTVAQSSQASTLASDQCPASAANHEQFCIQGGTSHQAPSESAGCTARPPGVCS